MFHFSNPAVDQWLSPDKKLHFLFSAAMAVGLSILPVGLTYQEAGAIALGVGLAKELKDGLSSDGSGFSYKDLVADALGVAVGLVVGNGFLIAGKFLQAQ